MRKVFFSAAIALCLTAPAAFAGPVANSDGDYTNTERGIGHQYWKVVDPDPKGLNCRMAKRFQGISMDAANVPDELLSRDFTPDISGTWEVVHRFRPNQQLKAVTGHFINQHLQFDDRGKPWMAVTGSRSPGSCFVRANRRFIKPI